MKTTIIALLALAAIACNKDRGNYNYAPPTDIEISGIPADTLYRLDQYDTLRLAPILRRHGAATNTAIDTAALAHEWKINYKTVSTSPNPAIVIRETPNKTTAYYPASLAITDKNTGLKYYRDFRLTVATSLTNGLFILSRRADETANLSFQRRDRPAAPLVHDLFEAANPTFGQLGKNPKQIFYQGLMGVKLGITCAGGDHPIAILDPATLALTRFYTAQAIRGGYSGDFTPELLTLHVGGMIAGGGKIYSYNYMNNEALYRPVPLVDGERQFAPWADTNPSVDAYLWVAYDDKAGEFVTLEPGNDPLLYDKITPLLPATAAQRFLAAGKYSSSSLRVILRDTTDNTACLYGLDVTYTMDPSTYAVIVNTALAPHTRVAGLVDASSACLYNTEYWYIATGNTLRRLHERGTAPLPWFTAPAGVITAIAPDIPGPSARRLFIATLDGDKSQIHTIDIANGNPLGAPLEMTGRIVSMLAKGAWSY
ncbi:MAG: hypothetical protein LBI96_04405 [Odoribacteraceae bacterium]|jgi:hypothetical protein|nr:hypothetical protein [Odoribacteraceae bacterium]